jgi:bacterioferritin-associated ferredoxin
MTGVLITRCVCRSFPFDQLLPLVKAGQWILEDVVAHTGCGDECGLCRPYLRAMIDTGQTEFRQLLPRDPVQSEGTDS